jgi:hypothetical protein
MNGFDPALDRGGVLDLFTRVLRDGGYLLHDPRALTFSQQRQTRAHLNRKALDFGYSLAVCCSKFFHDAELANSSAMTLRSWFATEQIGRFKSSLKAALKRQPHVPVTQILLEMAGALLATRAYRRAVQHVKNDCLRFRQNGIARKAA